MSEVVIIKLTDGEEREALVFPDGSWSCPYCGGANFPGDRAWPYPCANPACLAGARGSLENVQAIKARWAAEAEAKAARQRLEASREADRLKSQQEADAARLAFRQEADDHGYCMPCWNHATDYGRFPRLAKKVRHRLPANCPEARKQQLLREKAASR